jgi:hypothetical protein
MWGDEKLADLRRLLLDDPDLIWDRLGPALQQDRLVLVEGREPVLRATLRTEATVTAVTTALRRLARDRTSPDAPGDDAPTARRTRP